MLETLDRGSLRGIRDRAMLLIGFAGGLRRSEITGLDLGREQTEDGRGWIEIFDKGALVTLRGKTGWREVEIGRGSSDATCRVAAMSVPSGKRMLTRPAPARAGKIRCKGPAGIRWAKARPPWRISMRPSLAQGAVSVSEGGRA